MTFENLQFQWFLVICIELSWGERPVCHSSFTRAFIFGLSITRSRNTLLFRTNHLISLAIITIFFACTVIPIQDTLVFSYDWIILWGNISVSVISRWWSFESCSFFGPSRGRMFEIKSPILWCCCIFYVCFLMLLLNFFCHLYVILLNMCYIYYIQDDF